MPSQKVPSHGRLALPSLRMPMVIRNTLAQSTLSFEKTSCMRSTSRRVDRFCMCEDTWTWRCPLWSSLHKDTSFAFACAVSILGRPFALLGTKTSWTFAFASATPGRSWRIPRWRGLARWRGTSMAGDRSVHGEPAFAGLPASSDEFVRQVLGGAEVHFIGGLAGERRMRHLRVVLLDEEGNQRFEMSHGVERVEVQPLMLEGAPPSLDDRSRVGDLDLREHAAELLRSEGGVDRAVDVLESRVGDDRRAGVRRLAFFLGQVLAGGDEHLACRGGVKAGGKGPGEDLPAVVVDHGVKEGLRPVEQLEDRDIDMPVLVGAARADAEGGLGRAHAQARAAPAVLAHEAGPRGDRHEDLARPPGEEAERAQRHVTQTGIEHHVLDRGDLLAREPAGHRAGTGWPVVEAADLGRALPGVIARWRHADDPEDHHERKYRLGAGDRAQQACFVVRV